MASNNDGSNKGPNKPVPDNASKKPSALIDLKATEVDIRSPKTAPTSPGAAGAAGGPAVSQAASAVASAAADAASKVQGAASSLGSGQSARPLSSSVSEIAAAATKPSGSATGAATPGYSRPSGTAAAAGSATGQSSSGPSSSGSSTASPAAAAQARPASGGGLRGAATHLAAGLAGGLLALLGADALLPKSGPNGNVAGGVDRKSLQTLETRLGALETGSSGHVSSELAQRVAASDQRLAQIERLAAQLGEQQGRLASETKQVEEKLAAQPVMAGGVEAERVAKLEEMLTALSAAAATDPQRGRIPQLAAITGKLSDIEASVAAQIAAMRKSVTQEVDSRLGQSTEAAQTARSGTQRIDRELAGVKTETAQIVQRVDGLKSQSDRVELSVRGLREEASTLKAEVGAVREGLTRELAQVARPNDVTTALSPLTSKLSLLEQNVQGVVRGEDDRRANVERIVMALELGNLKRTVERGAAFSNELAEVRRIGGPKLDLTALERFKDKGVAGAGELEREFRSLAFRIIEAEAQPKEAHWSDRLIASAKSVVRVRKVDQGADDKSTEATVARMEAGLKAGKLADVVAEASKLSEQAKAPAVGWLEKVNARAAVDRAIAGIEQELKASLGAQSQPGKKG